MASTPSASALSAVLRCRGNIWARNPPTKRPAPAGYSLGVAVAAARDFPDERSRSNQTSAWGAFLRGERVAVGRRLTVEYGSARVDGKALRERYFGEINKSDHPKLRQTPKDARGVRNALVRQLARTMAPDLRLCSKVLQITQYETCTANMCRLVFVQAASRHPAGAVRVTITWPCLMENALQLLSTLTSTCLSLTALVSELVLLKTSSSSSSSSSSSPDCASHQLCQHPGKNTDRDVLQANGQTHSPTELTSSKGNFCCGQKITEDRPD